MEYDLGPTYNKNHCPLSINYATVGCHPETLGLECARRGMSRDRV